MLVYLLVETTLSKINYIVLAKIFENLFNAVYQGLPALASLNL